MKFKMAENSLFAILMRSRWWISFAICIVSLLLCLALYRRVDRTMLRPLQD